MGGFIFRLGVSLKDSGERLRQGWLIGLGLAIRGFALRHGEIDGGKVSIK
jgi:hypothetical protein